LKDDFFSAFGLQNSSEIVQGEESKSNEDNLNLPTDSGESSKESLTKITSKSSWTSWLNVDVVQNVIGQKSAASETEVINRLTHINR